MNSLLHSWTVSPKEAIEIQNKLRSQIELVPLINPIATIGGADVSMNLYSDKGFAGFVTLSFPDLKILDHAAVENHIPVPYIPGLLSFREIPMLMKAWEKLTTKPDVLVVDGVGMAHPRRLGIASHLGLMLGIPTIGCAKSVLTGTYEEPPAAAGSFSYLYDKKEIIGAALRTKNNVKPVFISPGHLITLDESIQIVKKCTIAHRLPEPTRMAHKVVNEYRIKNNVGNLY